MKSITLTVLLVLILHPYAYSQVKPAVADLMAKADSLRDHYKETEALDEYLKVLEVDSTNFRASWISAFLYTRIGNRFNDPEREKAYFKKAEQLARKALQIDSTDANSNWTMSVVLGRMTQVSSAKQRVALSADIKYYAEKALAYNPDLAGAWYVLGKWNFRLANLSLPERLAVRLLYGGFSSSASNQKAIEYYKKAISLDGDKLLYRLDLARVYHRSGDLVQEKAVLKQLLKLPVKSPDDPEYASQARQMLKSLD